MNLEIFAFLFVPILLFFFIHWIFDGLLKILSRFLNEKLKEF
jgi:hypothetical protein